MKLKLFLAAFAIMASGNLFAQNVTKADLVNLENQVNALSQKVEQLEGKLERVITENVNLVEQLNIKTITSYTDKNNIKWDIVKVQPNSENNKVVISLRLTNNSGLKQKVFIQPFYSYALDSDTNKSNNKYNVVETPGDLELEHGIPLNTTIAISGVPMTSSYLSLIQLGYGSPIYVKFQGIHVPW